MVTRDFFIISNAVHGITDADYKLADLLVNAAKAFARSTHQGVYIIDYFKMNFLYVSENLANWCGVPADKIREFGYQIYVDHVPEEEQKMLIEINRSGFNLFETIPVEERLDYTISYDFHFITGRKKTVDKPQPYPYDTDKGRKNLVSTMHCGYVLTQHSGTYSNEKIRF